MTVQAVAPRRSKRGSRSRLVSEYLEVREELVGALAALLGNADDAQDAAQEAFLKCWRGEANDRRVRNWRAWLFRVGLNAARDLQRNAFRRKARPLDDAPPLAGLDTTCPAEALLHHEEEERLRAALRELRREEQEVFVLRQTRGLTYEQIARRTRRPLGTIKTQMRSAIHKLRKALGGRPGSLTP
jgi:RNA polymerase sigma-70 factor (ECF subfamily)